MKFSVKRSKQTSMRGWTLTQEEAEARHTPLPGTAGKNTTEGKKGKAEESAENAKLKFNKRGELKVDEIKELTRTNKNIFSWLRPPTTHMIKVAEVVEIECQDEMENMDVVDAVWEERLERQLEWIAKMMCNELIQESTEISG